MSSPPVLATPVFDHLHRLTDARGLFEHAKFQTPRPEHGYCLDDVARALVVVCREPNLSAKLRAAGAQYLEFTLAATQPDGTCHNRMDTDGRWTDSSTVGDWWGRALWGLGTAAATAPSAAMKARALLGFRVAASIRSPYPHAMSFAALGAGELLRHLPDEQSAQSVLRDAAAMLGAPAAGTTSAWPWPEARLSYGNAALAEALLLAGSLLGQPKALARGLELLGFLLDIETEQGHLSVTPVGGRGPDEPRPAFDQQPIEVAALADACACAYAITAHPRWKEGITHAWAWFCGVNDTSTVMFDPGTGGGYDGLQRVGRNMNQGAESTLAALSTAQHARHFGLLL